MSRYFSACLPFCRTIFSAALPLALAACSSVQLPPAGSVPNMATAPEPSPAAMPATQASPQGTGSESTAAQPVVEVKPLQLEPTINASRLGGNPSPDSYAFREDARRLAREIAQANELDPLWVWEAIARAKVKESAARLMMPAPAGFAKNWGAYRSRFVEPIRIKAGTQFWRAFEPDLRRAELKYGVPASIIAGVLGVETIYGRNTGNFRVLDVLTTLSLDFPKGRSDRSDFFKAELGQYLKLCAEQKLDPELMQGSYAGAVGLPQFMPSSIRKFAVDFDGDGRIDLQKSPVDAIGSVAHYLAEHGWQADSPAYYRVTPPAESDALNKLLTPDILPSFSAREMQDLGAILPAEAQNYPGQLALVQLLNGQAAPTLIAGTVNFYAITRYNKSSYYALAVVQLGEAVSRAAARQFGQPE
jgi:membrane-bound lytic murein transglycosylase B